MRRFNSVVSLVLLAAGLAMALSGPAAAQVLEQHQQDRPDCEMQQALKLPLDPACSEADDGDAAVTPKVGTRGLAIGAGSMPTGPVPGPAPITRQRSSGPSAAPAVLPATLPQAGVTAIQAGLADIKRALQEVRDEQARLAQEQEAIKDLIGVTRLREIGRLDGRIDQVTDVLERMMRLVAEGTR